MKIEFVPEFNILENSIMENKELEEIKKIIITLKRLGWEIDDIQRFINLPREQIVAMTYGID